MLATMANGNHLQENPTDEPQQNTGKDRDTDEIKTIPKTGENKRKNIREDFTTFSSLSGKLFPAVFGRGFGASREREHRDASDIDRVHSIVVNFAPSRDRRVRDKNPDQQISECVVEVF